MIRYYICNFEKGLDFAVDDVAFQRVEDYKKRIQILKDEHRDQLTFYATVLDRRLSQPSMLFTGDSTTSVNDMMILLSLAQSRNIYYPKAEDIGDTETQMWGMPLGGNRKADGFEVIIGLEIVNFLNTALSQIRKPEWLDETGFMPAVFWWLESIYEGRPLETKFVSGFIALEILANIHANSKRIKNSGVKTRIKALRNSYGWNFMDDTRVKDWIDIRDKYMHTGRIKSLERFSKSKPLLSTRYIQLIWSVQIALIDLLGFSNFARREWIISDISKPIQEIHKASGPFPIPTCCNKKE